MTERSRTDTSATVLLPTRRAFGTHHRVPRRLRTVQPEPSICAEQSRRSQRIGDRTDHETDTGAEGCAERDAGISPSQQAHDYTETCAHRDAEPDPRGPFRLLGHDSEGSWRHDEEEGAKVADGRASIPDPLVLGDVWSMVRTEPLPYALGRGACRGRRTMPAQGRRFLCRPATPRPADDLQTCALAVPATAQIARRRNPTSANLRPLGYGPTRAPGNHDRPAFAGADGRRALRISDSTTSRR